MRPGGITYLFYFILKWLNDQAVLVYHIFVAIILESGSGLSEGFWCFIFITIHMSDVAVRLSCGSMHYNTPLYNALGSYYSVRISVGVYCRRKNTNSIIWLATFLSDSGPDTSPRGKHDNRYFRGEGLFRWVIHVIETLTCMHICTSELIRNMRSEQHHVSPNPLSRC